jgi:prepilin-type N-terminal cleavage/methylation domain-containing protein
MGGLDVESGKGSRGITLPELLVVVAIIALAVTVAVPLISDAVRAARVRTATDEFALSLMAARMLAVTRQAPVDVTVAVDPGNYFEYRDRSGELQRYEMPVGVRIVSSTSPITFEPNGMVDGGASTTIEARRGGSSVEVWEIETSILGVSTVTRRAAS